MALDRIGRISRIDLRLRPGADVGALQARLQAELPPGLLVERPQSDLQRNASMSRAYRVNLNVLALVALFTGGFLVFSTQALSVVRRRAQLALLRVLGVTRGGMVRMLLAEGALIGAAGAAHRTRRRLPDGRRRAPAFRRRPGRRVVPRRASRPACRSLGERAVLRARRRWSPWPAASRRRWKRRARRRRRR